MTKTSFEKTPDDKEENREKIVKELTDFVSKEGIVMFRGLQVAEDKDDETLIEEIEEPWDSLSEIMTKIKEAVPQLDEETLKLIASAIAMDVRKMKERKEYAVHILDRARKYIQSYLYDYKILWNLKLESYPLELVVKVFY